MFQKDRSDLENILESHKASAAVVAVLTALAFALRFYKINHPDQVVCVCPCSSYILDPVVTSSQ
jgi:dolichyl-phosphate-mannose--protein O-mannosyl transferase